MGGKHASLEGGKRHTRRCTSVIQKKTMEAEPIKRAREDDDADTSAASRQRIEGVRYPLIVCSRLFAQHAAL